MADRTRDFNATVRAWALETHGWHGATGGWIYNTRGNTICQGWYGVFSSHRTEILDWVTVRLTAFSSFKEMVEGTHHSYRPTIMPRNAQYRFLADQYDMAQMRRGDARRAFPGARRRILDSPVAGGLQ